MSEHGTDTWTRQHAGTDVLEIKVGNRWDTVAEDIFRTWTAERRLNGKPFLGDAYWSGSDDIKLKPTPPAYADTRCPWHIEVIDYDGSTIHEDDYSAEDGRTPAEVARFMSTKPRVSRVELTTTFVAGEQVSPQRNVAP